MTVIAKIKNEYGRHASVVFTGLIVNSKGSFTLGDDDFILICRHEWVAWIPMGLFTLDDEDKIQYDNVVVHWVLYPFHDDTVVNLLCRRRRRLLRTSPEHYFDSILIRSIVEKGFKSLV